MLHAIPYGMPNRLLFAPPRVRAKSRLPPSATRGQGVKKIKILGVRLCLILRYRSFLLHIAVVGLVLPADTLP